jgi:flavin-dependent dehydrogenase
MRKFMKIDIVGGGISGFTSAISLKEQNKNLNVNIYEKNKEIGYNYEGRKCGEAHTVEKEWSRWIPKDKSYFNNINKAVVRAGNSVFEYKVDTSLKNAFILNRPEFICQLARKAENLGVKIITNKKIIKKSQLDGEYIIDASGCPSIFKREFDLKKGIKGIGYQQTLENSNNFIKDTIKIWYRSEIGYYWIFPRDPIKKEINIGYGLFNINKIKRDNINLKQNLENFKLENSITGNIEYKIGGMIPIGIQYPLKYKNILFVGDAGVGCFPFQGQGIYRALLSGDLAGRCISNNKSNFYPYYVKKLFIKWDLIGKSFLFISDKLGYLNKKLVDLSWSFIIDKISKTLH